MANIIKDKTTLKQIAKKYHLEFCSIYGYYEGNAYNNSKGETLPHYFALTNKFKVPVRVFKLQYFSGCFNPFLVEVPVNSMVFSKETNEPVFPLYPNPKWDTNKFYTR
jgi:hypothetical protein